MATPDLSQSLSQPSNVSSTITISDDDNKHSKSFLQKQQSKENNTMDTTHDHDDGSGDDEGDEKDGVNQNVNPAIHSNNYAVAQYWNSRYQRSSGLFDW
jgi:hypothetical protein